MFNRSTLGDSSFEKGGALHGRLRGFSLFELFVVITLISILATVLLNRLAYYQEAAEKADMEYTISALKSALRLQISTLMVEGRLQETVLLAQQNPMEWLERKPPNYAGQFASPETGKISPGSWYFDTTDRALVYQVRRGEYFEAGKGEKRVRLKVELVSNSALGSGKSLTAHPADTVKLRLLEPYRWL